MFGNNRDGSNDQILARSGEALKVLSRACCWFGSQVTRGFPRTLEATMTGMQRKVYQGVEGRREEVET